MREIALVLMAFAGLAAFAFGAQWISQPAIYEGAWLSMAGLLIAAVVAETVYFASLFAALRTTGHIPERWFARSFMHHKRLSRGQRFWVLPWFYLGFLGLLVASVIACLLVFASIGMFQELGK